MGHTLGHPEKAPLTPSEDQGDMSCKIQDGTGYFSPYGEGMLGPKDEGETLSLMRGL